MGEVPSECEAERVATPPHLQEKQDTNFTNSRFHISQIHFMPLTMSLNTLPRSSKHENMSKLAQAGDSSTI